MSSPTGRTLRPNTCSTINAGESRTSGDSGRFLMRIANSELTVEIAPLGAELQSITSANGDNWLWHGDPAWWSGRAPLLFPVVGKSPDGAVTIEGKRYPMLP